MDSVLEKRRVHDRLHVPLKMSPYHLKQLKRGELKALQIITDRTGKWWVILAVRLVDVLKTVDTSLPPAVLGIDFGIKKAACTALITPEKVRETKYFVQKEKVRTIEKYDLLVASLQGEMDTRRKSEKPYDNVAAKLRKLKTKRENIAREYDRVLIKRLVDYISELSERYTLYVALGKLKHIRNKARRDSRKSREFRKMIHSLPFSRITNSLKYQLLQLGWPVDGRTSRFRVVPEAWTSILCWKCGSKGRRPKQSDFHCPSCGHKTNADRNGAINIAGRFITLTESLHSVRGRGKWADSVNTDKRSRLNSSQKTHSGRKSSLPHMDAISHPRESAVVHRTQLSLLDFSDGIKMDDNDPAVESTVETLSVVGSDSPTSGQRKETRSTGGISS
ncbi:MAG: zinc ribbon domain-containing protein [Candidatus Thorarchaeota archaeon]